MHVCGRNARLVAACESSLCVPVRVRHLSSPVMLQKYDAAKPMLDEFEVAYVMERLVDAVESGWCWPGFRVMGPLSDSGSDDDDYDMWYGQDLDDREPDGECIGCGAVGVAGGQ